MAKTQNQSVSIDLAAAAAIIRELNPRLRNARNQLITDKRRYELYHRTGDLYASLLDRGSRFFRCSLSTEQMMTVVLSTDQTDDRLARMDLMQAYKDFYGITGIDKQETFVAEYISDSRPEMSELPDRQARAIQDAVGAREKIEELSAQLGELELVG